MDIEQFRQFRTVARLNHLGRAAEALDRSQPALSQCIRRLEKHYGLALFDRVGRSIRLNESGALLLTHAERVLAVFDAADLAMRTAVRSQAQPLALGYFGSRRAKAIPRLIRQFHTANGLVDFGLFRGPDAVLFERLRDATLDVCFTSRASRDAGIRSEPLWNERLFLYVWRNHRLARRRSVDLREARDEPMVSLAKHTDFRAVTDAICADAGFVPRVVFEAQNVVTLHGLVATKIGVALAPELEGPEREGVVAVNVRSPNCQRPIYLSWAAQRSSSPMAERFRALVLQNRDTMRSIGLAPYPH